MITRDSENSRSPEIKKWIGLGVFAGVAEIVAGPVAKEASVALGLIGEAVEDFRKK